VSVDDKRVSDFRWNPPGPQKLKDLIALSSPDLVGSPAYRGVPMGEPGEPLEVAYVTQWFAPEPVEIPVWIAESLRRRGLDIRVLTGIPNFPDGKVQAGFSPWRGVCEISEGFPVVRAPLYPSHGRSAVRRFVNYASYAASSAIAGRGLLRRADVALVYSSPATAATAAMVSRTPYVLMIQDLWPDSIFATGFLATGMLRRVAETSVGWFTDSAYRRAAHVVVISPGMRDLLVERGVPAEKVSVVYNWVDEEVMKPAAPDADLRMRLGLTDEFLLMYGGNHGAAQALDVIVRAMAELRDLPDVQLVLVGDGIQKAALRSLVDELGLTTVHFLDPVAAERMPALMAAADLQLVSLADEALFRITLPSKVQSILACSNPVLACAPGDTAGVVEVAGAGFTTPPGDPVALARTIRQAHGTPRESLREMGRAGRAYYESNLSEAINAGALVELLRGAADERSGAGRG
jgi:glycosyltransferase involved in cell wall biosynthesis